MTSHQHSSNNSNRHQKSILVCDDDIATLKFMKIVLENSAPCTVYTSKNASDALDLLSSNEVDIDLLITDMCMPGISGLELLERYFVHPNYNSHIPIIICTASTDAEKWLRLVDTYKGENIQFLVKPVDLDALQRMLSKYFE